MNCVNCQTTTNNPKFCSMSCAAKYNNKLKPKRVKLPKLCKKCGSEVDRSRYAKLCSSCRPNKGQDLSLSDALYRDNGQWNQYTLIRTRARAVAKQNNMNKCTKCGYDKHVEIAHIKPISSFPDTAMISEINHISNLMALCPNCHWEFDHPS